MTHDSMARDEDSLLACPGVELFLDSQGDLYLLPVAGRTQLRVEAPWGRWARAALRGDSLEAMPLELASEVASVLEWLEDEGYARRARHVHSASTATWDRQVRWLAQETGDGPARQQRLADATVAVLGVGGLGCAVADHLARAGVGTLVLVDEDEVELANLARQSLFALPDVGRAKVDAAAERLQATIPNVQIERFTRSIRGAADVVAVFAEHDPQLVVCAADRPPISIKTWVEDAASAYGVAVMHGGHRPPLVYAGPFFVPGLSPCYECFARFQMAPGAERLEAELHAYRDLDCPQLPAVGWGDAMSASMMAGQCIQWLAGVRDPALLGCEFELDFTTLHSRFVRGPEHPMCERCDAVGLGLAAG